MQFDTRKRKQKRVIGIIFSWLLVIGVAVFLAYLLVTYVGQTTTMLGESMKPVVSNKDTVFVHKLAYSFKEPKRMDVIVFDSKNEENNHIYIKRIIGMPYETVQIKDGTVYINNKKLKGLPFKDSIITAGLAAEPMELGENEYFVLGDNVNNSEDSRSANMGNISRANIIGKLRVKK